MKLTSKQLKQIISETIDEMRIDTVAGSPRNQGTSVPTVEKTREEELVSRLEQEEPELYKWFVEQNVDPQFLDIDKGRWYIIYNAIDQGYRSHTLPDGWNSDTYAQGGSDEDTNYIITKDSDSDPYGLDWWENEKL